VKVCSVLPVIGVRGERGFAVFAVALMLSCGQVRASSDGTACVVEGSRVMDCEGGCTVNAAFALRCPSSVRDLELAGTNLLVEHDEGAELFGFHFEAGLTALRHWGEPELWRALTVTRDDAPIVVHERVDGTLAFDPGSPADDRVPFTVGVPYDVRYDDDLLHVLAGTTAGLILGSFDSDGRGRYTTLSERASTALFVDGTSPPRVVFNLGQFDTDPVSSFDGEESAPVTSLPPFHAIADTISAAAAGERLLLAYQPDHNPQSVPMSTDWNGTVEVIDDGISTIVGTPRTLECPASFTAHGTDDCEFERVPPATVSNAVLAAQLVVHEGEPWLVTVVAEVTDRCDTLSLACTETSPCECVYTRSGSAARVELRLAALDEPSRTFSLRLRAFPDALVSVESSSTAAGALVIAVSERPIRAQENAAETMTIDYLMVTP
jgi:hypothetical protein